jgi:hypothetical protein
VLDKKETTMKKKSRGRKTYSWEKKMEGGGEREENISVSREREMDGQTECDGHRWQCRLKTNTNS